MPPSASKIIVLSTASNGIVPHGMSFLINCSADGSISPIPVITLSHEGNVIGTVTGHQLLHTVFSVTESDEGNYTCQVSNRQGNVMKSLPNLIDVVQGTGNNAFGFYMTYFDSSTSKCQGVYVSDKPTPKCDNRN